MVSESRHPPKLNYSSVLDNYFNVEHRGAKVTNSVSVRVIQRHYPSVLLITYKFYSESYAAPAAAHY
jgi:hypothetical protein